MATRKRLKREAAERSGPIRNKALGSSPEPARNSGARYTVGTAIDEGINSACRVVEVADATVRGAVERGVNTAYTVIEEYMLRGRQSATGLFWRVPVGTMIEMGTPAPLTLDQVSDADGTSQTVLLTENLNLAVTILRLERGGGFRMPRGTSPLESPCPGHETEPRSAWHSVIPRAVLAKQAGPKRHRSHSAMIPSHRTARSMRTGRTL